jgi:ectoine hydroxylase-related dioxygenase (phytanoyl-CoA dioxygenase family)
MNGPAPAAPTRVVSGFVDSTPLLAAPEQLRARAAADGFLFFKGYLPVEPLLELRRQILAVADRHGWIKQGTDLMEAVADLEAIAASDLQDESLRYIGVTRAAYRDIQSLELFHALPHHPRIIALYESLFGAAVLPHPRHIARVLLPAPSFAPTPPHQDYIYIQGTHQFWTLWFPLGDCPVPLGGLSVLRGSQREPVLAVTEARGAGQRESILCGQDYAWVQGDYACGDVITFSSHTVHRGTPNLRRDRIRVSLDLRYQPADQEIEPQSLVPHGNVASWDELYRGWRNENLKYYWKSGPLKMSAWDPSLLQTKERIC